MELGHGWDVIVNRSSEPFTVGFQTRGTAPGDGLTECEDLDSFGQTHMATVVEIVTSSLHPQETESDARTSTPLVVGYILYSRATGGQFI